MIRMDGLMRADKSRMGLLSRAGFTLIELLLVMVILTILAAVIVPKFVNRGKEAKITATKADISAIATAMDTFEIDNGRYPTTEEGINALLVQPTGLTDWHGPYIGKTSGNDPWGNPFIYKCPGEHNTDGFDLYSYGPDGQEGGGDAIDNWTTN